MRAHQPDRRVHFAQQLARLPLQLTRVAPTAGASHLFQLRAEALPKLADLTHLRLDVRRLDRADIARRVASEQVTMDLVELRHGRIEGRLGDHLVTQQQGFLGHLLTEHALRAGDVDGLRRHRHAQVQGHRGGDRQHEHQGVGEEKLLVQGAQTNRA
ncbi:hypothetical protein D9M69_653480 [compost metagenome]